MLNAVTNISKGCILTSEFAHQVTVPWSPRASTMRVWNEICADAVELFGLPGDRYMTQPNINDMTWYFRSEADALLFKLKFSEVIQ